jgi:hypothetical protein
MWVTKEARPQRAGVTHRACASRHTSTTTIVCDRARLRAERGVQSRLSWFERAWAVEGTVSHAAHTADRVTERCIRWSTPKVLLDCYGPES